jgi:hypothetical protein
MFHNDPVKRNNKYPTVQKEIQGVLSSPFSGRKWKHLTKIREKGLAGCQNRGETGISTLCTPSIVVRVLVVLVLSIFDLNRTSQATCIERFCFKVRVRVRILCCTKKSILKD